MAVPRSVVIVILVISLLTIVATAAPLIFTSGPGPSVHLSVRGEVVELYGYGPYRQMPAEVAIQGLAQDLITLLVAVPMLLLSLWRTQRGSTVAYLVLTGSVGYLFVQYVLYLAMAMYNELFLVWVVLVLLLFQALVRLLLYGVGAVASWHRPSVDTRRYVGCFLLVNGTIIGLLWLNVVLPPLLQGTLYPTGLAHFTTMIVQGFDLALFLPASLFAGYYYLRRSNAGDILAPVYAVFLSLQMAALLAKIGWMAALGMSAGPALLIIPMLLLGAVIAAYLALKPHQRRSTIGV
ncbi:hypothetical protein [Devosia naphthalenivorans]|uniref:hypothetical protein n=1 Tax=Devosia naphthalenivorans TaxID=2082392 RepID=UPI000D3B2381|nr:hypothetical protein [Devosia naphthalenivorans]